VVVLRGAWDARCLRVPGAPGGLLAGGCPSACSGLVAPRASIVLVCHHGIGKVGLILTYVPYSAPDGFVFAYPVTTFRVFAHRRS